MTGQETARVLRVAALLAEGKCWPAAALAAHSGLSETELIPPLTTLSQWGLEILTPAPGCYQLAAPLQLLDEAALNAAVPVGRVRVLPVIDSTNRYMMQNVRTLQCGDAYLAEYQTAARGRWGRKWLSPFGANIYLSVYWRFSGGMQEAAGLSLAIGIAAAEVLRDAGLNAIKVKWPNDLWLHNRKLAGILVESAGQVEEAVHLVIGMGVNVAMNSAASAAAGQPLTSLAEAGVTVDRNQLAAALINAVHAALRLFEREGLTAFLARWRQLDNFLNTPVKLIFRQKEIHGIARGIDAQGALLLEQNGVITSWTVGEVSLRPA